MNIEIEKNVMTPMRDGVNLAADIYRPVEEGRYPVLLSRLPYNKDLPGRLAALASLAFRAVPPALAPRARGRWCPRGPGVAGPE